MDLALAGIAVAISLLLTPPTQVAQKPLSSTDILDLVGDYHHDNFDELARRLATASGFEEGSLETSERNTPLLLSDSVKLTNVRITRTEGVIRHIHMVFDEAQCFPMRTVVLRTYAEGPGYTHGDASYEILTPWTYTTLTPHKDSRCLGSVGTSARGSEPRTFKPQNLERKDAGAAGTLDDALHSLRTGEQRISKTIGIIAAGHRKSGDKEAYAVLNDGSRITFARKYVYGEPFALAFHVSENPCYPLARAISFLDGRIPYFISGDDALRFESQQDDYNIRTYANREDPFCLGAVIAYGPDK